jgi:thiol-disulfide isomerase/thioredoxin
MKKQLILASFASIILCFLITPYFCYRLRGTEGLINFITIHLIAGFFIGFLDKIDNIKKILIISLPTQIFLLIPIFLYYFSPEWEILVVNFHEYLLIAPLSVCFGLYLQNDVKNKFWKYAGVKVFFCISILSLLFYYLPNYYFYMYSLKNVQNKNLPKTIEMRDLSGAKIDYQSFKDKVLVIDFWSSSCGSCLAQMADIKRTEEKYKYNSKIQFFSINSGNPDSYQKFKSSKHVSLYKKDLKFIFDENQHLSKSLNIEKFPQTYIVDKNGKVRKHIEGYWGKDNNFSSNLSYEINRILSEK